MCRKYSERYNHGHEFLIGKIDPCFILQLPQSIVIRFAGPEHFDSLRMNYEWETQDPEVISWNPVIRALDNKVELIWSTSFCGYVLSGVRGHPVPFGSKKMNSKIWKSLTVYVSCGRLNLSTSEAG